MTTDLWVLVAVGLGSMVLAFVPGLGRIARGGIGWAFGNRQTGFKAEAGWIARAVRAHANLMENLPLFVILVLVAHVTGSNDAVTATACVVFAGARALHAIIYIAGITYVRTIVFYVGLAAELAILWRIVA